MVTVDTQKDTRTLFEPVVDNPYRLSYVCLMIPRFQSHYLQGDLVEYLHIWIQQICISYGWQLEYLDVQPEYMQWLVNVPVNVSSAIIIRVLRQILSERIFEEFPKFRKQNVGKDFWAPGHLVVVGRQLHSPDTIKEFIRLTRLQQAPGSFNLD